MRSARCSRLENIRNNVFREKMNIKNSILDYVRYKQLNWYGHVQRMDDERLPRKMLVWCPPRSSKKGKTSKFVDAGGYNRIEGRGN